MMNWLSRRGTRVLVAVAVRPAGDGHRLTVEQLTSPNTVRLSTTRHAPAPSEQVRPGDESIKVETQTPDLDLDIRDLESSGAMVHRAVFRPSEDQEVLVVAATDVEAVVRRLSPSLPNQLCVVRTRFTPA